MDIAALSKQITDIVKKDATLAAYLGKGFFYVGIADTFPAITLDGIVCLDDKQGKFSANLNLYAVKAKDRFVDTAAFYAMVGRLKDLINLHSQVVGGAWYDKSSDSHYRAMFPISFWQ